MVEPYTASPSSMKQVYGLVLLFYSVNAIVQMILPLHGQETGLDNRWIGAMVGSYLLASMLLRPWIGLFLERFDRQNTLRIILVLHVVAATGYALVDNTAMYIVIRVLQGAVAACFSLLIQTAIMDGTTEQNRAQGLSLFLLFSMLPSVLGPAFALQIWQSGGYNGFVLSIAVFASAACVYGWANRVPYPIQSSQTDYNIAERGQRRIWRNVLLMPGFIVSSIIMLCASTGFGAVSAFLTLYIQESHFGHAGLFFGIQSGVMVLTRFALRKALPSNGKWPAAFLGVMLLAMCIGLLLIALSPTIHKVWLLYTGAVLLGLGMAQIYPLLAAYLSVVHSSTRRIWLGLFISTSDLGIVIGNVAMGFIADLTGYAFIYLLCALFVAIAALLAWLGKYVVAVGSSCLK